ncbi:hypothetical protein CVIRNUC_004154 [Coccomyxa viridis]|uniref:ASCH domain-containing protein n=1 Tax=Coccomyxa viridis TaxID=1274662 RepID=A0AAV1I4Y0_9CHLO|nr:hypothetical protein CVIRNUC_004154 [Coccomyxa viridis]
MFGSDHQPSALNLPCQLPAEPLHPAHRPCDDGLCLSLHQPWAQLLVHGIKRIEGRAWSSNHRGRVWIHATSARPETQTIRELEHFYTEVHGDLKVHFPSDYPTSALVGCVNVVDVLTAEQVGAWEELPGCVKLEVGSPRAFLCEDPRFLARPISMRGHPKLWQLPPQILSRAEACLQLPPQIGPQPFCWMAWHMPPDLKRRQLAPNPRRHLFRDRYQSQQPLPVSQGKRQLRVGAAEGNLSSPEKARRVGRDNARLPVDMAQVANSWEGLQTHH